MSARGRAIAHLKRKGLVIISLDEVLVSTLHKYVGARLSMDFYTMVAISPFIILSIEGHCNIDGSGEVEA